VSGPDRRGPVEPLAHDDGARRAGRDEFDRLLYARRYILAPDDFEPEFREEVLGGRRQQVHRRALLPVREFERGAREIQAKSAPAMRGGNCHGSQKSAVRIELESRASDNTSVLFGDQQARPMVREPVEREVIVLEQSLDLLTRGLVGRSNRHGGSLCSRRRGRAACELSCARTGWKAAARALGESLGIPVHGIHVREGVLNGDADRIQHRIGQFRHAVVHPQTVAPGLDQSGAPSVRKMT